MSKEIDPIVANYLQNAEVRAMTAKAAIAEQEKRTLEHKANLEPFRGSFAALGQLLSTLSSQVNEHTKTESLRVKVDVDRISFNTKDFSCRISFVDQGFGRIPIIDFDNHVRPIKMVPERSGNNVHWYCLDAPQSKRETVQELAEFVFWLERKSHS